MPYSSALPDGYSADSAALAGKKILITGAASDLGHAVSLALADHGAEMVFIERKERMVTSVYDAIVARGGIEPLTVAFDLAKAEPAQMDQLAASLDTEFKAIDGVVYLATSAAPLSPLPLSKPDVWQSFHQTMVLTPLWLTNALLPLLEQSACASVIFPGISAGQKGRAYWGPVGSAFAALGNICETFSAEQKAIRFNTLAPGKVSSAVRHKYYPAEAQSSLRDCDDPLLLKHFVYLLDPQTTLTGEHLRVPDKVLQT